MQTALNLLLFSRFQNYCVQIIILTSFCEVILNILVSAVSYRLMDENKKNLPYIEHAVVHYKQNYNWDCGVSCVLMLLNDEQRENFLKRFNEIIDEEGFGHSTWTIDLSYLLMRYNIKHRMFTTTIGLNENNIRHGYYDKIINLDRDRVIRRFKEASSHGLEVEERSVSVEELISHLNNEGPAIVLVDGSLLVCDLCKHNKLKAEFRRCFGGGYKGHYVLAVGHRAGKLVYRDPALSARLCACSFPRLQRARLASGTDQDLILIYTKR